MYKNFAAEAREEGFNEIAALFEMVAKIERSHDERYQALLKYLEDGKVFLKDGSVINPFNRFVIMFSWVSL